MDPAERLQRLWEQGQQPDLDLFLAEIGSLTPEQLLVVLRVDQRRRWQQGAPVRAEAYLEKYAFLRDDSERVVDLIYSEYLLREAAGEAPVVEEYVLRFPEYANDLRTQIGLHGAMASWAITDPSPSSSENSSSQATAAANRDISPDRRGPSIPGFEILDFIGQGGMGVVYKARQLRLKRIVALKMLLAGEYAGREQLARFRTEAEAAARLHHPNIVEIYEVGDVEGRPFLVLEYVAGGNLKQNLGATLQTARSAAQLVETLARAMYYAHQQGVVHRDLKPANILMAERRSRTSGLSGEQDAPDFYLTSDKAILNRVPKITDFGLAKQISASITSGQTQSGAVLGTPSYMAPEQAVGKAREVGPAADIYALGAVLYELVTGRPPFLADTPLETLQQVARDEPVMPSRLQRAMARDLETICLKCLQKEPHKRYASCLALAEDLARFLAGEPIHARPVGYAERLWRWCKRKPAVAALMALTLVAAVVIVVGSLSAAIRMERVARERLWETKLAEARAYRFSNQSERRFKALEALFEAAHIRPTAELRDEAIAALALLDCRPIKEWQGLPPGSGQVEFDGEHRRYARAEQSGDVSVRLVEDDTEIYRLPQVGSNLVLRLSNDGQFLAAHAPDQDRLTLWRLTGAHAALIAQYVEVNGAFSVNSKQYALARPDGTLILYDLEEGKEVKQFKTGITPGGLAFQPGEQRLAIGSGSTVHIFDLQRGKSETVLELETSAGRMAWHPAGQVLAVVEGKDILLWDVPAGKQTRRLHGETSGGTMFAFSRAGDLLASIGWSGILRIWDTQSGQLLFHHPAAFTLPRFGPDDRTLAAEVGNGMLRLWEVSRSPAYRTLVRSPVRDKGGYGVLAISGTGLAKNRLLAASVPDGIALFDLARDTEIGFIPIGYARTVLFDSTGAMWTNGVSGILRWPVRDHADSPNRLAPNRLVIGPPEKLPSPTSGEEMACSRDGSVLAIARYTGGLVLHLDPTRPIVALAPHDDVRYVAVSPDGRFAATGSQRGTPVKIWNTGTGVLVKELSARGITARFNADGRWLYTTGFPGQLWSVPSWQAGPQVGGTAFAGLPAFSADGQLLALDNGNGIIRIVETNTGRDLARLQDPNRDSPFDIAFSPDGAQLVSVSMDKKSIRIWDLAAIGWELNQLGLKWDMPIVAGLHVRAKQSGALEVKVISGDADEKSSQELDRLRLSLSRNPGNPDLHEARARFHMEKGRMQEALQDWNKVIDSRPNAECLASRGECFSRLKKPVEASKDWRAALVSNPSGSQKADICNSLAWLYATGPKELRAAAEAVTLAERALRLDPGNWTYQNTLGVANYRAGRFKEAIVSLEKSLKGGAGQADAFDLYFLALSQHRLGNSAKARACFDTARAWHEQKSKQLPKEQAEELKRFQAEAKEVLNAR
jgi:serine/threonine protein kinase/WD40 repeat protein/tetratricopeptide (TPR) repeat protein